LLLVILISELLWLIYGLILLIFVNVLVPPKLTSLKSLICNSPLLVCIILLWLFLISARMFGMWLVILFKTFDYVLCYRNWWLSEVPSFLDPATDFLFFIYYKSDLMRFNNLGSVKSEFYWFLTNLKLLLLGDWNLFIRGEVCPLWFYFKLCWCDSFLDFYD